MWFSDSLPWPIVVEVLISIESDQKPKEHTQYGLKSKEKVIACCIVSLLNRPEEAKYLGCERSVLSLGCFRLLCAAIYVNEDRLDECGIAFIVFRSENLWVATLLYFLKSLEATWEFFFKFGHLEELKEKCTVLIMTLFSNSIDKNFIHFLIVREYSMLFSQDVIMSDYVSMCILYILIINSEIH